MGFWQGVAEAYKDISSERTREKEIEEERAFQREMFTKKLAESRRSTLLEALAKRRAASSEGSDVAARAAGLVGKLGDMADDERAQAILKNPYAAAELNDTVDKYNAERAKNELPPLSAEQILMGANIYGGSTGTAAAEFSYEDLEALDTTDDKAFEEAYIKLNMPGAKPSAGYVSLDTTYLSPESGERSKAAAETFNSLVFQKASMDLSNMGEEAAGYTQLTSILDAAQKNPNGYEMQILYDKYGPGVMTEYLRSDDPNAREIVRNPVVMNRIKAGKTVSDLIGVLQQPNIPDETRMVADDTLKTIVQLTELSSSGQESSGAFAGALGVVADSVELMKDPNLTTEELEMAKEPIQDIMQLLTIINDPQRSDDDRSRAVRILTQIRSKRGEQ